MLGLSLRCIGSSEQTMVYDDLSIPIRTVARGEISHEYYYKQSRDITWTMRNDYLRKYLMSKYHFLSRCKTLHELLNYIKTSYLKEFLHKSGIEIERYGNLKLLEIITNILDFLNENSWSVSSWQNSAHLFGWKKRNPMLVPLFINNDIRQMDAHVKQDKSLPSLLQGLGFDSAELRAGYGTALDFIFDQVTNAIKSINNKLSTFLEWCTFS